MDYEKLRRDLIEYYGSAAMSGLPMATIELIHIEKASPEQLLQYARRAGFDLRKYQK